MDPSLCKDFNIFHPHNKVDYISQGNYLPNPSHEILSQVEMEWIQDLWKVLTKYINTEITMMILSYSSRDVKKKQHHLCQANTLDTIRASLLQLNLR